MVQQFDFRRLEIRFSRAQHAPHLRERALDLIEAIDEENSTSALESIIVSDPALAARVLAASKALPIGPHDRSYTTVHGAILRLGTRAVRNIAISMSVQGFLERLPDGPCFRTIRFASHSLFVGCMAAHVLEQGLHHERFGSLWSPDELLAAGVIHELPVATLWMLAPDEFSALVEHVQHRGTSLSAAFEAAYGVPMWRLGVKLLESWALSPDFAEVMRKLEAPWDHPDCDPAIYALHYADLIARMAGFRVGIWDLVAEPRNDVVAKVGLPGEVLESSIAAITHLVKVQYRKIAADAA
ncbi:MAG: HDOD domain-containing protein [Fimbriimonadaceae bacterium]